MDIIETIEKELGDSTLSRYKCLDGTEISTNVGYICQWFDEYKKHIKNNSNLSNSRLTCKEKEQLLKFFLTHCVIEQIDDIEKSVCPYKIEFFGTESINKEYGQLIIKAMDNLRGDALCLN